MWTSGEIWKKKIPLNPTSTGANLRWDVTLTWALHGGDDGGSGDGGRGCLLFVEPRVSALLSSLNSRRGHCGGMWDLGGCISRGWSELGRRRLHHQGSPWVCSPLIAGVLQWGRGGTGAGLRLGPPAVQSLVSTRIPVKGMVVVEDVDGRGSRCDGEPPARLLCGGTETRPTPLMVCWRHGEIRFRGCNKAGEEEEEC